ncbi:MAG: hypothetical protein R2991_16580 [Thermoanaerobaculia bacterium]
MQLVLGEPRVEELLQANQHDAVASARQEAGGLEGAGEAVRLLPRHAGPTVELEDVARRRVAVELSVQERLDQPPVEVGEQGPRLAPRRGGLIGGRRVDVDVERRDDQAEAVAGVESPQPMSGA